MTQQQLDEAVALATGEDVRDVQHLGFSVADPADVMFDPEPYDRPPQEIDWDLVDLERSVALCQ